VEQVGVGFIDLVTLSFLKKPFRKFALISKVKTKFASMNIQLIPSLTTQNTVIIPVVENDALIYTLEKIAEITGADATDLADDFKAKAKETLSFYADAKSFKKVILIGLGKEPKTRKVIETFRSFFYKNKKKLMGDIAIDLKSGNTSDLTEYIVNGVFLASYEISFLRTEEKKGNDFYEGDNLLTLVSEKNVEQAAQKGKFTADTQRNMLQLVDSPANYKTPQQMAQYVVNSGEQNGFKTTIYDAAQCEEIGLHALLAVGRGSIDNPPVFIVMEYDGTTEKAKNTIGLVGKGVTFDTGGVSLKPGDNMNYMKSDMGGAAAVIGTIELLAKLKAPVKVIAIVPATENCIDGKAIKPGDVINSYAGKTIEVINTDAEGRLILADGLSYMKRNFNPDIMIDLATLTGSAIRALGFGTAALMSNNDLLVENLYKAAEQTDEKVWRMPLWDDEYKDMMRSDVADIMNLSVAPVAGAITAAKFIEFFIDEHPNWAHLDIAGVAFGSSEYGKMKSGTAYGIRLLTEFILKEG
jgi:leucyl aminopeptidase